MTIAIKKLFPSFLVLVIVLILFFRLGLWQWHRAAEFNATPQERPRVSLASVAVGGKSLEPSAIGRRITTTGTYQRSWLVTDRSVGKRTGTWQVAVLTTDSGAVLVVRGWSTSDMSMPSGEVRVEGRLYPSQTPETSVAATSDQYLSRVDPALIVNRVSAPLIDGFVIATSESPASQVGIDRVDAPLPRPNPPGFYWQHISYVILWWFSGLLAIVVWLRSAREQVARYRLQRGHTVN